MFVYDFKGRCFYLVLFTNKYHQHSFAAAKLYQAPVIIMLCMYVVYDMIGEETHCGSQD